MTVFEGSKKYASYTEETIRLNDVSDRCTVIPSVVGPEFGVYERDVGGRVDPQALPTCDVLEMDAEGAELDILKDLAIRPRILIVEMHPRQGPYSVQELGKKGGPLGGGGVAALRQAELHREHVGGVQSRVGLNDPRKATESKAGGGQ